MYVSHRIYTAKMRCPHCNHVFGLTDYQLTNNSTFVCPKCRNKNYGSVTADSTGALIGTKSARSFERIYGGY